MSTDGGNTFQDILAVGGSFAMGGYNRTISNDRGSPIAGRQAWSGSSEGFITTMVDLPVIQIPGKLRWRMASDTNGSNEGWRVDTVDITWCQGDGHTVSDAIADANAADANPLGYTHRDSECYTDGNAYPSVTPTVTPTPRVTPRPRPTPAPRPTPR